MRGGDYERPCLSCRRYQIAVHGDDPRDLNPRRYSKFLVDSPFPPAQPGVDPEAPECGYGAFHMQYRLDGRLVAVGVVDVLPRCLSRQEAAPLANDQISVLNGW